MPRTDAVARSAASARSAIGGTGIQDDFGDASIDTTIFSAITDISSVATQRGMTALTGALIGGSSVIKAPVEQSGKLEIDLTSPNANGTFGAIKGVGLNSDISANKEVPIGWDVVFNLSTVTGSNGNQGFGIGFMGQEGPEFGDRSSAIVRYFQSSNNNVLLSSSISFRKQVDGVVTNIGSVNTQVTSGKFKIKSLGSDNFEGFYDIGAGFVSLGVGNIPDSAGSDASRIAYGVGSIQDQAFTRPINVKFDNYKGPGFSVGRQVASARTAVA